MLSYIGIFDTLYIVEMQKFLCFKAHILFPASFRRDEDCHRSYMTRIRGGGSQFRYDFLPR